MKLGTDSSRTGIKRMRDKGGGKFVRLGNGSFVLSGPKAAHVVFLFPLVEIQSVMLTTNK